MFLDKLEIIMGGELYRPKSQYLAKYCMQPRVVHDFSATPGGVVRMKRYGFWNDPGAYTETSRERQPGQVIGTGGSRGISQEEVLLTLKEFTGPSAGNTTNPNEPGNLKIPMWSLVTAQRNLYNLATADQFHDSIGSMTLIDDYQKWQDRVYINLALGANTVTATGGQIASSSQGGYYNPGGIANGGTYNTTTGVPTFDINRDLLQIVSDMRTRLVPPFQSNMGDVYHCLCSPAFMRTLRQDPEFRKVAQYPGIPISMLAPGSSDMAAMQMAPYMDWKMSPNQLIQAGGFAGQTGFMHSQVLPMGLIFEGVRFFETTNLPTISPTLTYSGLADQGYANQSAAAALGSQAIFFGQDLIGEGVWSRGPKVLLNSNDDYKRFLIAIWQQYSGYTVLNKNNVTIARTF